MLRRPPSSAPPESSLFEKYPHLEAEWQSGMGGDRSELLDIYEKLSVYTGVAPIDWKKPEGFERAERACGEISASINLLHKLSTMAADYTYDDNTMDHGHRNALLHKIGGLNAMLVSAQVTMESIEALAEYRWLQNNVNGDFSAMPQEWRKRYTNTPCLLSERRFEMLKEQSEDPETMHRAEETLAATFQYLHANLDELAQFMNQAGPLLGTASREARMLSIADHNTCLHELIPHAHDQLTVAQGQLQTLVNHATLDMATRRKGEVGAGVSKIGYLNTEFRKPEDAPQTNTPNPNNVTSIGEAHRIRAKNAEKGRNST